MSLFIGTLAFGDPDNGRAVRLGVLSGSLVSALLGYLVLRPPRRRPAAGDAGSRPGTRGVTGQAQERLAPLAANWRTVPLRQDDEDLHLWQMVSRPGAVERLAAGEAGPNFWSILPSGAGFL